MHNAYYTPHTVHRINKIAQSIPFAMAKSLTITEQYAQTNFTSRNDKEVIKKRNPLGFYILHTQHNYSTVGGLNDSWTRMRG